MKIRSAAVDLFRATGRTDRYGEANYCAVGGAGYFEVVRVVECATRFDRWIVRVGRVADSRLWSADP